MPNPMFLQVMGVSIHEYNTYTPAKRARFQKAAIAAIAKVSSDPAAYTKLTEATATATNSAELDAIEAAAEDEENT